MTTTTITTIILLLAIGILPLYSGQRVSAIKLPSSQLQSNRNQDNNGQQQNDDGQQQNNENQQQSDGRTLQPPMQQGLQLGSFDNNPYINQSQISNTGSLPLTAIDNCCYLGYDHFTFSKKTADSGVYLISNFCGRHYNAEAYCDTDNGGGGWLVVQRRLYGSVDFNRTWADYANGFGNLAGEFWYGLKALHCLTGQGGWEMRMDFTMTSGYRPSNIHLQYEEFKVASAKEKYNLTVGGFSGNYWDIMAASSGMQFSTKNRDHDQDTDNKCGLHGGWWYGVCPSVVIHPNGFYNEPGYSSTEIKIRPVNCNI